MSVAWGALALAVWVVLSGLALAAMVCRAERSPSAVRVLTVAMAGGLSVWFLGSELLARLGVLSTAGAVTGTAIVGVLSLAVMLGPGRRGFAKLWCAPVLAELGVLVGATMVAAAPLIVLILTRRDSVSGSTPWYYLDLARAVAQTHGVPAHSIEWATRIPFLDDYPGYSSATALLMAVGGSKSMAAIQAVRLITLLAVGGSAYLFARTMGAARSAAAVSVGILFVGTTYVGKLASYRPEATGYMLVFLVAALARLWLTERRNVDLALAAIALLALSEVHGIGWLFSALIVSGIAVAAVVFSADRRRDLRSGLLLGGALIGAWLLGNLALGGGLSGAGKLGGLPDADAATDPTWRFANLVAGHPETRSRQSVSTLVGRSISRGFIELGGWWLLAVTFAVLAALVMLAWLGRPALRRAAAQYSLMAVLVVAATVAVSVWFTVRWSTYVPLRTGWGRLFPLTYALLPAGVALVITAAPSRKARVVAAAVVLAITLGVMVHGRDTFERIDNEQPSRTELAALRGLGLNENDLVLTNVYSEGFVGAVVGADGALDGRAPYSEPKTLKRANRLLADSIRYFADPITAPLPPGAPGVDYILITTEPSVLGTPSVFPTNIGALEQSPHLRLVREGDGFQLYAVNASP
jgi:hypothetical protein